MARGKFITFEGCEGVGKTTQINLLKEYLKRTNQQATFTREPGGVEIAEQIRDIILKPSNTAMDGKTEMLLYTAARAQHLREVVVPALESGELVVCDRFVDSSYAYQGYARGLGMDAVRMINEYVVGDYMPDLTVFIDLEPSNSFRNKSKIVIEDRMEQESSAFHNKVYEGFIQAIEMSNGRMVSIIPSAEKKELTSKRIIELLQGRGLIK